MLLKKDWRSYAASRKPKICTSAASMAYHGLNLSLFSLLQDELKSYLYKYTKHLPITDWDWWLYTIDLGELIINWFLTIFYCVH